MAKLNIARPNIARPNVVKLNTVKLNTFEPDRFESETFDPSPEDEEWQKFKEDFKELNERNRKALDKFCMTDGEMYKLILDNMAMQVKLLLRCK